MRVERPSTKNRMQHRAAPKKKASAADRFSVRAGAGAGGGSAKSRPPPPSPHCWLKELIGAGPAAACGLIYDVPPPPPRRRFGAALVLHSSERY